MSITKFQQFIRPCSSFFARYLYIFSIPYLLAGCSNVAYNKYNRIESLQFFIARGSSLGSEFEQHSMNIKTVYAECGAFSFGETVTKETYSQALDSEFFNTIQVRAQDMQQLLKNANLNEAGTAYGAFDRGIVKISIVDSQNSETFETDLDSVVQARSQAYESVRKVLKLLRSQLPKKFCNNVNFYGITR
jgi:hypothetical protein